MNRKLTLSLDAAVIDFAHEYARQNQQSVSKMVENYFVEQQSKSEAKLDLPPKLAELYGVFAGKSVPDKKELRRMFHEKHHR
jgi:hypothetical protein